jgi:hypothetical protein
MFELDDDMRSMPGTFIECDAACPTEGCVNYGTIHHVVIYIAPDTEAQCVCGHCGAHNVLTNIVELH